MTHSPATAPSRSRRWTRLLLRLLILLVLFGIGAAVFVWRAPFAAGAIAGRATLRLSGFEKVTASASRGPITYFRAGQGPPLIFLHGANDQAGTWARIAPAFTATHRVVVADLAGHGQAQPSEGPLEFGDLVAGVRAVVEAERQGGRVVLVGNSLGGFLSLEHALHHPDQVALVVAVNGAVFRGGNQQAAGLLLPKTRAEARRVIEALMSPKSPRVPDFVLDDLLRRTPTTPLARLMASPPESMQRWLIDDRLGDIRTPVALVWGADDRLIPISYAEQAREKLPSATLQTIADCGHVPQRECPAKLLPVLQTAVTAAR
jgi:pimeloyl-ACP methyl ester carboxylesterase